MSSKVNFKLISLNSRWIDSVLDIERLCYIAPWNRESIEQSLVGYEAIGAVVGPKQLVSYLMYSHVLDEVSILNVAVHPDYRRQGLAAAMLSWLNQHAKELGVKKVFLEVSRSNQKAQALYKKFGYRQIGTRKAYYRDTGDDALIMSLEL